MSSPEARSRAALISTEPLVAVGTTSGLFRGTARSVADIWAHRDLLGLLVRREIKSRYKDSSLGVLWSLFRPIAQLLIYYLAIGQVLGAARATPDFAIFVFIGLTMWGLFSEIVQSSTTSILANSGLVKKVYLPREIFPLSSIGGALFNFLVQLIVLVLAIIFLASVPFDWSAGILLAPASVITLVVFSTAIGLFLSAVNVYLRDAQHLVEIALIILFWASPIVYSYTYVHKLLQGNWLEQLYLANPVTIAILGMQRALWSAGDTATGPMAQVWPPGLGIRLLVVFVISIVLLWLAQRVFARLQGNFAQEL
ncbi:ABC transporter permease [Leifsonia shinshuensis]|uniref:ABC transporter permease n=1 Tax=Leifsonia shinshuensis TaxID=150026 RepID=UPI001F5060FA|nr:ABC transporter permease [Leifsonia shinshuensis]MCI0158202.1 ABC transporter permease [Leifsonia shinshuensis]